jgi:DNA-binding transcriptional LysR family regulator
MESNFHYWKNQTMADLDNILIFIKVAQFRSITGAARSLGMPISTVSRRLSVLESELGVSLLRRSTRQVTLTAEGRDYFIQCQGPLALLQEAEQVLTQAQKRPEGLLRITVPVVLSQEPFFDFISGFVKEHPRIQVELVVTNQLLDLIADNIDVALRVGELRDSSVVAKRLGSEVYHLVAAPEYLHERGIPTAPADLESHDCVMFHTQNNQRDWDLSNGRKKVRVHVSGPVASRDINSVRAFVRRGHGIGLLPATLCPGGKLMRVLPGWTSSPIPVFALYSSRKFLPLRLSTFLEALSAWKSPLWVKD